MDIPRAEYPRPQLVRERWLCLNGEWQFEMDCGDSGLERGLLGRELKSRIIVPFCPESSLSGIGNIDFMPAVWYRRTITIPDDWAGSRVLLHFQAVDEDATVWVNGIEVGRHRGGFAPFTCDVTRAAHPGMEAVIVVRARDDAREWKPMGKQSRAYANAACHYTRTTGIWQTVWLEPAPRTALERPRITPDITNGCFYIEQRLDGAREPGLHIRVRLCTEAGEIARVDCPADQDFQPKAMLLVPSEHRRFWSPSDPFLYTLYIELRDSHGNLLDQAESYAGLRGICLDGKTIRINGQTIFQRLVLDQGYYPDGIMTAPTEEALVDDIRLSLEAGFNGARLHQKVFEERFLYHADRMGYLVWAEFPNWGSREEPGKEHTRATYITQWLEAIERDYSHPSIIGWCPLNETVEYLGDRITELDDVTWGMFLATKALDGTRPVLDTSGYAHRIPQNDVYDSHDYDQNPETFAARHAALADGKPYLNEANGRAISIPYGGQPYFVSEFGGIWWNPEAREGENSWGYGDRPTSIEEFYTRFEGLCAALLDNSDMFGYCYTQLTDVFQEQNGIYTFDRRTKFDMKRIRAAQERPAAIEPMSF